MSTEKAFSMGKGKNKRAHQELIYSAPKARKLEWDYKSQQVQQRYPQTYERTSRIRNEETNSGAYERYTAKEKVSGGARHVEKGSGQVGVKNELTWSSKVKIGNKSGYTEVYTEERVREVDFSKNSGGNTNYEYDDGGEFNYGGGISNYDDGGEYNYGGDISNYDDGCEYNNGGISNYDDGVEYNNGGISNYDDGDEYNNGGISNYGDGGEYNYGGGFGEYSSDGDY